MQKSYVSSGAVTVHWKGFYDDESHIKDLECALFSENGESVMAFYPAFGSSFNIIMNQTQSLTDGHSYRAILKVHAFCFSERTLFCILHLFKGNKFHTFLRRQPIMPFCQPLYIQTISLLIHRLHVKGLCLMVPEKMR